jgi:pyridoxine 5-phosphate synthase
MNRPRLNINIDHVATLRQARLGENPDPVFAAYLCELAGADGIVAHLREDRRHIQERDIKLLKETVKSKLNLEMAPTDQMVNTALMIKPDMITIVPEKRQELTTEGGFNLKNNLNHISDIVKTFRSHNIITSLFIDPDYSQIELSKKTESEMIEIHTGKYANLNKDLKNQKIELVNIIESVKIARELDIRVSAGHGLDYSNTYNIVKISGIEELNIGYSIVCRSIIVGIEKAVKDMIEIFRLSSY